MKREEIKAIFPDASDEQLEKVMILNNKEVERGKKLESELKEVKEQLDTVNKEFETLKSTNAGAEEYKTKYEALVADNEAKAKQAEADRILAEKNTDIEKRFTACVGDKTFTHEAIKAAYLKKFAEAIESEEYKGKGDADIFHALTKDDATAFTGVTAVRLNGGFSQTTGIKYKSKADIMAIKDSTERQQAIADNISLFQ